MKRCSGLACWIADPVGPCSRWCRRAQRAGWRIEEVPVTYRPRWIGKSKVTGTVKGTLRAVGDMSRLLIAMEDRG